MNKDRVCGAIMFLMAIVIAFIASVFSVSSYQFALSGVCLAA